MITQYFLDKDSTAKLIDEPSNHEYKSFNTGSIECDVGEFLYGLVKMVKPRQILETGTYKGWGCAYMAQAIKEIGVGHVETLEYEPVHIRRTKERLVALELQDCVTIYQEDSREFIPTHKYDLMLLDTEPQQRFQELIKFYPHLSSGGYVFLHDLPRSLCQGRINPDHPEFKSWPWGDLPKQIQDWVDSGELKPWMFDTPRGLVGFYKRHQEDYL